MSFDSDILVSGTSVSSSIVLNSGNDTVINMMADHSIFVGDGSNGTVDGDLYYNSSGSYINLTTVGTSVAKTEVFDTVAGGDSSISAMPAVDIQIVINSTPTTTNNKTITLMIPETIIENGSQSTQPIPIRDPLDEEYRPKNNLYVPIYVVDNEQVILGTFKLEKTGYMTIFLGYDSAFTGLPPSDIGFYEINYTYCV